MISKRDFMQFIGLAPAAAVVKPSAAEVPQVVAQRTVQLGAKKMFFDEWGDPVQDYHKELASRKQRLKAFRAQRERGLPTGDGIPDHCYCIESRKATSTAIKQILQCEHRLKRREYHLENSVTLWEMMPNLPTWMRNFLRY